MLRMCKMTKRQKNGGKKLFEESHLHFVPDESLDAIISQTKNLKYQISPAETCGKYTATNPPFPSLFYHFLNIMGFSIIPVEEIDIPFVDLQAQQPDIERFSASTLIFLF